MENVYALLTPFGQLVYEVILLALVMSGIYYWWRRLGEWLQRPKPLHKMSDAELDRLLDTQREPKRQAAETSAMAFFDEALRNAWTRFFAADITEETVVAEMGELMKELTWKLQLTRVNRQYDAEELKRLIAALQYLSMLRTIHVADPNTDEPCELLARAIRLLTATRELRLAESRNS